MALMMVLVMVLLVALLVTLMVVLLVSIARMGYEYLCCKFFVVALCRFFMIRVIEIVLPALKYCVFVSFFLLSSCNGGFSYKQLMPYKYWVSMPMFENVNASPEFKIGLKGGCMMAIKKRALPGYLRSFSSLTLDSTMILNDDYRAGFTNGFVFCALKSGYYANAPSFQIPSMLDYPLPDQFSYRKK